jgi:hypothetical protein
MTTEVLSSSSKLRLHPDQVAREPDLHGGRNPKSAVNRVGKKQINEKMTKKSVIRNFAENQINSQQMGSLIGGLNNIIPTGKGTWSHPTGVSFDYCSDTTDTNTGTTTYKFDDEAGYNEARRRTGM